MTSSAQMLSPRRRATRQRLLAAARQVIVERGLAGASVEEISERAGFTRGAFYSNFASKDDLVVALAREVMASAGERRTVPDTTLPEALRATVEHCLAGRDRALDDVVLVAELRLWAVRRPEFRRLHNELVARLQADVAASLDEVTRSAGARYTVDPRVAARTVHALVDYYRFQSLLHGEQGERGDGERLQGEMPQGALPRGDGRADPLAADHIVAVAALMIAMPEPAAS